MTVPRSPVSVLRLTAIAAVLSGAGFLSACNSSSSASGPASAAVAPAVSVVTLAAHDVALSRELPGRVVASLEAEVRPQVSGIIKERLFVEGGPVKAGQPLYQLDDEVYRADLANAEAALARAQSNLKRAQLSAKRSAELVKIDAVSKQSNEDAVAALSLAQADVAAAKAAVQSKAVLVRFAKITSPISGFIGKSSVTQGALVTANQPDALASIQTLDPVYVDLTQSSFELLELRRALAQGHTASSEGLPVEIRLENGLRYPFDGKLQFSDITVDPSSGSYGLRVAVPNPDKLLLPGMYVRAEVGQGVRKDAILVPQQAVVRDPKGSATVMVVGADDKVEVRPVQLSRAIGDKWLVMDGLVAGDRVVVEGLQKIRPGVNVLATEFEPQAAPATSAERS